MKFITSNRYYSIAFILIAVGIGVGVVGYTRDTNNYSYLLTVGASNTQVNIQTPDKIYSVMVFVAGALFSTGLSMICAFPKFDKSGQKRG